MIKDLTQGNLYRHLATLSIPLLFGNILQQFYNTIDAFVVGRYAGNEQFAAIGIASTIMNLFLFILVGACSGLSVLFAHYYGLRDFKKLHQQHFISLVFGFVTSIGLCIFGLLFLNLILQLIQTPDHLFNYTYSYLWWIFLALPASFLYNMYASALRASGDTITSLVILAIAVCMNLVLDIFFVVYLHQGIQGAAIATCLTQFGSAIFCILYLLFKHKEFLFTKEDCRFDPFLCRLTLQCSSAMSLQQCNLYIGKLLIQGIINTGGTEIIAAYTAATRIEGFINSFGDSGSTSTSILISQNHGANKIGRVKEAYHCSFCYLFTLGIACSILLFFSSKQTIYFMLGTNQSDAYIYGVQYLKIILFFYPLCFIGNALTGFFDGLKKVSITVIGTTSHIILRVILSYTFFSYFQLNTIALATVLVGYWQSLSGSIKPSLLQNLNKPIIIPLTFKLILKV